MSLADLRKELKEIRKTEVRPVSRMKKHEIASELERRKGSTGKKESSEDAVIKKVKKVEKILEKAKAPEVVVEKAVKKVAEKKKSVK